MGYRNYLGSLPKREYNKIKKFTLKELYEYKGEEWSDDPYNRDGHVGVYDIASTTHYELGKYVDSFYTKFFKDVFLNKETQKHFTEESDFYIVEKEFLLVVIEYYKGKVKDYYRDLLEPFFEGTESKAPFMKSKDAPITEGELTGIYNMITHVRDMGMEWGVAGWFEDSTPYNLKDSESSKIVTSWKYEYAIFQLVHLYHTFDWKRNVMIYYGY